MTTTYQDVLREFAGHIGLDDVDGLLASGEIVIDGVAISLLVDEEMAPGNVLAVSDLGAPPEASETLYRRLLEANLLWAGTGGATLGVHPDTGRVFLAYRHPLAELDGQGLAEVLDRFADMAASWRDYLVSQPRTSLPDSSALA